VAENTAISWADSTFNPWVGCSKVSPGCAHCYAETLVTGRMGRPGTWGEDGTRERTSEANWRKPLAWNRRAAERGIRERVFCASLADAFEPRPELEPWRFDLFTLIEQTPALDWLILTKRPELARDFLRDYYFALGDRPGLFGREWVSRDGLGWGVLPNVWIGTSIENARFTWRADVLREIPATVRFLSCEPLLGSLFEDTPERLKAEETLDRINGLPPVHYKQPLDLTGIDWVIVGGESGGRDARPMHPDWAREIRDAVLKLGMFHDRDAECTCDLDSITHEPWCPTRRGRRPAFHMKQWGSWSPDATGTCEPAVFLGHDGRQVGRMGLDADPLALAESEPVYRMGYRGAAPTAGGKFLDGIDWCEVPEPGAALTPA
jgi:protein gp37